MDIRKAITTRWQRLKLGAGMLSAGVAPDAGEGSGILARNGADGDAENGADAGADKHREVTPFAGEPTTGQPPSQLPNQPPRQQRGGLGDLVHGSWKAFFARFREDERKKNEG